MHPITVAGIPITVERKAIKNMYLRVYPDGTARITAPRAMPEERIRAFAQSRADWIERQLRRHQSHSASPEPQYAAGEHFPLWGRQLPLDVIPAAKTCRAELTDDRIVLYAPADSSAEQRKAALDALCRVQLQEAITALRNECEALVGRQAAEYRIRDMHTRWGSCSIARRRVWLSLQLAKHDPVCLRYVMLHELTHLWESGHGPRFQAYMDRFCPDWRAIRQKLNHPVQNH